MRWQVSALTVALVAFAPDAKAQGAQAAHDDLVKKHATAHGVPEQLVRRVIAIESRGNPKVISGGNYGLMQIRLGTARAMGYQGEPQGLLDADTNMTYAVKYLAGAYRAAGCDPALAISYYQHGYSGAAKTKCTATMQLAGARSEIRPEIKTETKRDAKPADRPATKAEREVVFAPSIADPEAKPPPAPTDVLKAKVVQTLSIPARDAQTATPAAPAMKQDALPRQLPAAKPDTFAARADLAGVHASASARASLEPEPMVAPPARKKAEPQPTKRRKARVERATAEPRVVRTKHKRARDKVEAEAKPSGDLISALKKLVTPEQKQPPARKPRKEADAQR
jgi:hypothetical protein